MRVRSVRLPQKNIKAEGYENKFHENFCAMNNNESGCHTKQTTIMAEVYSNNAVVLDTTTYIKTHGIHL